MPFAVPLLVSTERSRTLSSSLEPIRFGLPCAPGALQDDTPLHVTHATGVLPVQAEVQDRWPDGSVRWLLVDLALPPDVRDLTLTTAEARPTAASGLPSLALTQVDDSWVIDTGPAVVRAGRGGLLGVTAVDAEGIRVDLAGAELVVTAHNGQPAAVDISEVRLVRQGHRAAVFEFMGRATVGDGPLVVRGEFDVFAGLASIRFRVTLRNPRAATHPNGNFELGSPASLRLRSVVARLPLAGVASVALDRGDGTSHDGRTVSLHQESSGGDRWNHHTHIDAQRRVPLAYRGFRVDVDGVQHEGLRAEPLLSVRSGDMAVSAALPRFWQNFPRALSGGPEGLSIALFPEMALGPHELQGGEQKTHEFVLHFERRVPGSGYGAPDEPHPLAWVRSPRLVHASPEYYASTRAIPGLVPKSASSSPGYERLVDSAIEGADSFDAKREAIDEYGWRHFGDIWGDHEAVFYKGDDAPLVSHYNNQYDPIQGFAFQFLRSADPRWWRHMDELAAHVVDIDVYHTGEDKSAYNHGIFWHTQHYVDADTSTHRAYPKRGGSGGGPSGGHLYTSGLLLHSYLTGSRISRETMFELADFVISSDDGNLTVMKWLSRARTGNPTASGTEHYHGPGRAPGNSVNALLDALRTSGEARYASKLREIVRRVLHPATDIERLDLLDAENKWFYMMYAHSLGKYLDWCLEVDRRDEDYEYARASFLHLMRWSAAHERPYLEEPDKLEYPTETWAAQDMRKCDVFLAAARHAADVDERHRYLERARFFFGYSVSALEEFPTRTLCRPVVLLLSFGWRWFGEHDGATMRAPQPLPRRDWGPPPTFVPQKAQFMRRAKALVALGIAAAVVLLLAVIIWYVNAYAL